MSVTKVTPIFPVFAASHVERSVTKVTVHHITSGFSPSVTKATDLPSFSS
jgi:hypothetical protein